MPVTKWPNKHTETNVQPIPGTSQKQMKFKVGNLIKRNENESGNKTTISFYSSSKMKTISSINFIFI